MSRSNQHERSKNALSRHKSSATNKEFSLAQPQWSPTLSQTTHSNNNKRECESHFFELNPLMPNLRFEKALVRMVHEGDSKPFPIVMTEFMNVEMMPVFGLENEIPQYRRKIKKCQEGLQHELSKINHEQFRQGLRPEKMMTPLPKHSVCQVCNQRFDDYKGHIENWKHKKNAKESLGMDYISTTIEEMKMAIYDQNFQEELKCLMDFNLCLEETIPCVRQHYKQFLKKLNQIRHN